MSIGDNCRATTASSTLSAHYGRFGKPYCLNSAKGRVCPAILATMTGNSARHVNGPAAISRIGRTETEETACIRAGAATRSGLNVEELQSELRKPRHREMGATLEYLASVLSCTVYIEDARGHLLFSQRDAVPDDWRTDFTPLSSPSFADYGSIAEGWRQHAYAYATLPGDQSVDFQRTVVPLVYHGAAFAFVHFVSSPFLGERSASLTANAVLAVADKLFMLFFGEMNEHREKTLLHAKADAECRHTHVLPWSLCFRAAFHIPSPHPLVDYSSIARRIGRIFAEHLQREDLAIAQPRIDVTESPTEVRLAVHLRTNADLDLVTVSEAAKAILDRLHWRMKVGIGVAVLDHSDGNPEEALLERACREAGAVLAFADRARSQAQVLTRKDVPAHSLVLFRDESPSFRAYAAFVTRTLEAADPDLEATARAYALNDCNASATATALLVDRRTVSDRLHRISQLTGLDIPSFSAKVIIYLAFSAPAQ